MCLKCSKNVWWCVWSVPFLQCRRVLWDYWWWRRTPLPRGSGCLSAAHGEEFLVQSEHPEERARAASGRLRWHGTSRHCNRTTLWLHHWHSGPESLCPSQISVKQLHFFQIRLNALRCLPVFNSHKLCNIWMYFEKTLYLHLKAEYLNDSKHLDVKWSL